MKKILFLLAILSTIFIISSGTSYAELSNQDILDNVLNQYRTAAKSWASVIQNYAEYFFGGLAVMGFVWQLSQAYFHRPDFAGIIGETIRYIAFCGIFLWFLRNGPELAKDIIDAMQTIGAEAAGVSKEFYPSNIVDIGFKIYDTAQKNLELSGESIANFAISLIILIVFTLIGVNMLLQLCSAWVLAYAGVIFLGFGGSYWTKDMAINYFKTVLGVGVSLMTMTLLIGIGNSITTDAVAQMNNSGVQQLTEMAALLVTAITLFLLVDKLPSLVAGIINGASIGSAGIGAFGAGAAVGAALTAKEYSTSLIKQSASLMAGAAKAGAAGALGAAGGVAAYKAARNSLIGEQADIASKMQAHREEAGLPPESGFAKPPSATAVIGRMGQASYAMAKQSLKNTVADAAGAVSQTAGGKLADKFKE